MRSLVWSLAAAAMAVASSGCTDMCYFGGCEYQVHVPAYEFSASIGDYSTNVGGKPIGLAAETDLNAFDAALLEAMGKVELRDASGQLVPAKVEVRQPEWGVEELSWCPEAGYSGQSRCALVTPEAPLAGGWYTLAPGPAIEQWSQGKGVAAPTTRFHVGSKPMIRSMYLVTKGGLTGAIELSEPIVLTRMDEFISVKASPGPGQCTRWLGTNSSTNDQPLLSDGLLCGFSIDQEVQVSVKPGLVSASGAPLQTMDGATEFSFWLGPKKVLDEKTNDGMREWKIAGQQ